MFVIIKIHLVKCFYGNKVVHLKLITVTSIKIVCFIVASVLASSITLNTKENGKKKFYSTLSDIYTATNVKRKERMRKSSTHQAIINKTTYSNEASNISWPTSENYCEM